MFTFVQNRCSRSPEYAVAKAETSKVDLSSVLERALGDELMAVETRAWSAENALAIKAYNKFVDEIGCFGEEFREF